MDIKLESRALKASVVLDPAALAGVEVPNGLSKVTLRVAVPGKTITAEVNAKSLQRTVAAIAAAGPNGVAVVLAWCWIPATCSPRPASQPSRRRRSLCRRTDRGKTRVGYLIWTKMGRADRATRECPLGTGMYSRFGEL